jgi:putative transposase
MVWMERSRMDERIQLVSEYLRGERAMTALCDDFGVSRKTAYKWVVRYHEEGPGGLVDRSRAPHEHPNRVDGTVLEALVWARREHPHWGARKLIAWLGKNQPALKMPAASTVSAILTKYGLTRARQARRRTPPYTDPFANADVPNRVWCADFKGDFHTGDGKRCYPLTVTDACSRMLLCCTALGSTKTPPVQKLFDLAFREYGLPERLRTDNGTPFASRGAGGLSRLSIWWLKLGIQHERIEPGHPEQNGRHERMHRTLKQETIKPPAKNSRDQQSRFDAFRREYNEERPHEALGERPPNSVYKASTRSYPCKLLDVRYPEHFTLRKVAMSGRIRWKGTLLSINHALEGEWIGIESAGEADQVYYFDRRLGFIDQRRPELGLIRPPNKCWARVK